MHFLDLILKKRNGYALSTEEISYFISGVVDGRIPDYQVSALLMAIWFSKMNDRETIDLTRAMRDSGDVIDLSDIPGVIADKHSTGGVADTTTLVTAPLVCACGLKLAKISGRGLGHTGGTLDKLESIPGVTTSIDMAAFKEIVARDGMAVIGQTAELVPADKLLYSLRDVTGTVDNISLIAASIMSKKLASGSGVIVLDVKTGNGAFMKDHDQAKALAEAMVTIGQAAGKKVRALVSDMNQPLGNAVGNALEVKEAIEILQGKHDGRLKKLSMALAEEMLLAGGVAGDAQTAKERVQHALESGQALACLGKMIAAQGGNPKVCEDTGILPSADQTVVVRAEAGGVIREIITREIGTAAQLLGAGRAKKEDRIDPAVGSWMDVREGGQVGKGDRLATFHVNDTRHLDAAVIRFKNAIKITDAIPVERPLIYETIS